LKFVDEVSIYIRSGKGGDGCVSFLRQKFLPKGGPDGGNGGKGGDIIFVADPNLNTLLDFRYQQHYTAQNGESGAGRQRYGKAGEDLRIRVPVGTLISDVESGEQLADLDRSESEFIAAPGGKGGKGNMHFATSTNQAPRYAEPGEHAVERKVRLTLKLLADVGLIGFPNAGKSTLISRISAAKPKIADYPFTTLTPNLGMVRVSPEHSFVVADIPGLIEGAAEGHGLGHRFLKHVERVKVLAFLVSVAPGEEGRDPIADYRTLVSELGRYSEDLLAKPRVLVLSKMDLPDAQAWEEQVRELAASESIPCFPISAVANIGLDPLVYALLERVEGRSPSD
jgi:GTPase